MPTPDIDALRGEPVTHFKDSDLPGEKDLPHDLRWQDYYGVRNSVLEALRPFGTVGPMGTVKINSDEDGPPRPVPVEALHPEFFVVDDMWNDWNRYVVVETEHPELISAAALQEVRSMLRARHRGWAVGLATETGYVLVTTDGFLVKGRAYKNSKTVGDVLDSLASQGHRLRR